MTIASEIEELRDIIDRAYTKSGMRATHAELMETVDVPAHIQDYLAARGKSGQISAYFKERREDGLPFAPIVNDQRQHVPLALADFDEIEYFVIGCVKRGNAELAQARRGAELARERFGRSVVINGVDYSAAERSVA